MKCDEHEQLLFLYVYTFHIFYVVLKYIFCTTHSLFYCQSFHFNTLTLTTHINVHKHTQKHLQFFVLAFQVLRNGLLKHNCAEEEALFKKKKERNC